MDVFRPTLLKTIESKDDSTQDEQKIQVWMLHRSRNCEHFVVHVKQQLEVLPPTWVNS